MGSSENEGRHKFATYTATIATTSSESDKAVPLGRTSKELTLMFSLTDRLRVNGYQALEFVDKRAVPPASLRFAAHRFQRLLNRQRRPIRSICGERVIDIYGLQDSCSKRNLVALQTV